MRVAQNWSTSEGRDDTGAIESRQWVGLSHAVVPGDDEGARRLGSRYLAEVRRFTRGLVRPHTRHRGVDLVLAGVVPLLRFGPEQLGVGPDRVECRFPIIGGLLAARPGGWLVIAQRSTTEPELELVVAGYFPRLGVSPRKRSLRRALYSALQARAHRAISRRFLEHAARGESR